jgi:hypothetical protein
MEMLEQVLRTIGNIEVISMLIPLGAFIVFYRLWSPWRENELGIALMGQKIALTILVTAIVAGNFLPEDWDLVRLAVRVLAFTAVLGFLVIDVINLRYTQMNRPNRLLFGRFIYKPRPRRKR